MYHRSLGGLRRVIIAGVVAFVITGFTALTSGIVGTEAVVWWQLTRNETKELGNKSTEWLFRSA